jgi:sugar phosphate isomerase/epimerase
MKQDNTMNQSQADPWAGPSIHPFSRRSFLGRAAAGAVFCVTGCPTQAGRSPKDRAKSFRLDLGVCRSFGDAAVAKRSGLDYIEDGVQRFLVPDKPDADFQEILKAAGKADLPVRVCNGFLPASLRLTGPETKHEEASAFAENAIRRAGASGIHILVLGSGGARKVPDGFDRHEARGQFIRFCRGLGPVARRHGVTIVLEPLNRNETNLLNSVAEGVSYVDAVGHPNVQLLADFYHMLQENEGPESLVLAGTRLRHCHIAEKKGRTPPGVDGDDFRPYFKALRQVGYQGGLSFECRWTDFETELTRARRVMLDQWTSL